MYVYTYIYLPEISVPVLGAVICQEGCGEFRRSLGLRQRGLRPKSEKESGSGKSDLSRCLERENPRRYGRRL